MLAIIWINTEGKSLIMELGPAYVKITLKSGPGKTSSTEHLEWILLKESERAFNGVQTPARQASTDYASYTITTVPPFASNPQSGSVSMLPSYTGNTLFKGCIWKVGC